MKLRPLPFWAMLLLPILMRFTRDPEVLSRRARLTTKLRERDRENRRIARLLKPEAKTYIDITQSALVRLRQAHLAKQDHESAAGSPKGKVQKVQFEIVRTNPEIIYLKILARRKTFMGTLKNTLPYGVRVTDIIHEDTLRELSYACERTVTAKYEDPRKGAWILIHRNEGIGGIPTMIRFGEMLEHYPANMSTAPIILGVGDHRSAHRADLAAYPHVLVGGTSGGGKSNMINHIISSLMRLTDPSEIKFILIDLKRLEFNFYKDAPHLYCPIITSIEGAIERLEECLEELFKRADLLGAVEVKELSVYNERFPDKAMPRIIVIIDEFAELMLSEDKKMATRVEKLVERISNLGRAIGIHLIVCTQRPAVQVLPNTIKGNMPLILATRVPTPAHSNVILGLADAARIPKIPGRMIYLAGDLQQIQTPYITDDEVRESVRIAKGKAAKLIRMERTEPVINFDALVSYLTGTGKPCDQGMARHLLGYGISSEMFKRFLAMAFKRGDMEINGAVYRLEKRNGIGQMIRVADAVEVEIEQPQEQPSEQIELLALPEPQAEEDDTEPVEAQSMPEMEPTPVAPPAPAKKYNIQAISPSDLIPAFLDDECVIDPSERVLFGDLYKAYCPWIEGQKKTPVSKQEFGSALNELGIKRLSTNGKSYRLGLKLKAKTIEQNSAEKSSAAA